MKRIVILVLACVFAAGLAAVYATNSYGFLWFGKNKDRNLETATLTVQGMHCEGCQAAVAAALQKQDGVKFAKVDYATGTAKVCFEKGKASVQSLSSAIVAAGYTVSGCDPSTCTNAADCAAMKDAAGTMASSGCCAGKDAKAVSAEGAGSCESATSMKTVSADGVARCPYSGATKASTMEAAGMGACPHAAEGTGAGTCPHKAGAKAASTQEAKSGSCPHASEANAAPAAPKTKES